MIGLGVDSVDVDRFRLVLARTPRLRLRVFTTAEVAYSTLQRDPTQRLAVRFAAKEATMKALGVGLGRVRLADIEVTHQSSGAPGLRLHGGAAALAEQLGVSRWWLSMSHTELVATAVVVAE
ncbi:MAG: holo-ACP synthase [Acidimicrobiales bacterium]